MVQGIYRPCSEIGGYGEWLYDGHANVQEREKNGKDMNLDSYLEEMERREDGVDELFDKIYRMCVYEGVGNWKVYVSPSVYRILAKWGIFSINGNEILEH